MYIFNVVILEEVVDGDGHFSEIVKRAVETYLTCDTEYIATIPHLTDFLVSIGVLEESLEDTIEERYVPRFNFTNSGTQEN